MRTGYSGLRVTDARPDGGKVRKYNCDANVSPESCASCSVRADKVEDDVVRQVLATLARTNLARAHVRQSVTDSRDLVERIARDETELDRFASDLAAERIKRREWEAFRGPVAERIESNRRRLDAFEKESDVPDGAWSGITPDVWAGYSLAEKRAVTAVLISSVYVSKGQRGQRWDGSRLRIDWRLS